MQMMSSHVISLISGSQSSLNASELMVALHNIELDKGVELKARAPPPLPALIGGST